MSWGSSEGLRSPRNGAERCLGALVGGLVHGLAFRLVLYPDYYLWTLAPLAGFLGLCAMIWSLRGSSPRGGAAQGFFGWALAAAAGLYWMTEATQLGYALLVVHFALLGLIFGLLAVALRRAAGSATWVPLVAALWAVMELVRAHLFTGLPWMLTSSLFAGIPWVTDPADVGGAYMVSFMTALLAALLVGRRPKRALLRLLAAGLLIAGWLGYGAARQYVFAGDRGQARNLRLAILQPRVPFKVGPKADPEQQLVEQQELMKAIAPESADLVIWSETMVPGDLVEQVGKLLAPMAREKKCWLLAGGVVHLPPPPGGDMTAARNYNSAVLISPRGEVVGRYDKRHLVPFGEYVPLGGELPGSTQIFDLIGTVFTPGAPDQALPEAGGIPLGISICFEDVFPHIARDDARRGARLLVNLTNDSWFRESSEARQHLALAALRAVETRRPMVRATNSGISALISPDGRITVPENGGLWKKGLVRLDLSLGDPSNAPYVLAGDLFGYICAAAVLLGLLAGTLPRRGGPERAAAAPRPAPLDADEGEGSDDALPGGPEMLEPPPEEEPAEPLDESGGDEPSEEPEGEPRTAEEPAADESEPSDQAPEEPEPEPESAAPPSAREREALTADFDDLSEKHAGQESPAPLRDEVNGARRVRSKMEDTIYLPGEKRPSGRQEPPEDSEEAPEDEDAV